MMASGSETSARAEGHSHTRKAHIRTDFLASGTQIKKLMRSIFGRRG